MMMLLDGHSLTQKDVLRPENVSAELKLEGGSSLSFNVGPNEPDIPIDSWIRWATPQGKTVIWRVKSAEDNYNTGTRSVQAEDLTATLRDGLIFGEVTTEMLAGETGAKTVSARKAFEYILAQQQLWSLGDFEYDVSLPYDFNNAKLYDALETICSGLQDWWWDVDYTAFTISVRHKPESFSCEMRETRNLVSLKKRIDRSNMYTRFYPVGNRNMHITGEYVSQNEQIYGVICHQETDQSKDTEEMLRAWAVDKLARHCEPIVTVTVSGLELSASTGEELDRLTLGTLCRIPLPEIGAVITERIISLKWSDAENRPEEVSVTMANNLQDVQTIVSNLSKSAGGGAGASAKNAEEDHAWFVDTTTKVGMVAESIVGRDADGNPNWSKVATLMVEGNQIEGRVVEAEGEIVTHETRITQNEQAITLEATNRENADSTLSGRITVEAGRITQEVNDRAGADSVLEGKITVEKDRITQEVSDRTNGDATLDGKITVEKDRITQEVTDRTNADSTLNGKITVNANKIGLVVTESSGQNVVNAASIVVGINSQDPSASSYVNISASRVNLSGYVTATSLDSDIAAIPVLHGMSGSFTGSLRVASAIYLGADATDVSKNLATSVKELQLTRSGNTYTLQKKAFNDANWVDVGNFSRAVGTWSVGGGSGNVNVTANPQGQTKSVPVSIGGSNSITSNGTYTYKVYYENADGDDVETGSSMDVAVNVYPGSMSISQAGWHSTMGNVHYGKLYYWDDDDESYSPVVNSNKYWYYSDSNKSGTTTVHY